MSNLALFLQAAIRLASPLLLAACGGLLSELAGVLSIGMEAMMLTGAFAGATVAYFGGNVWIGTIAAVLTGSFVASLYGFFAITLRARQAIVGTACGLLAGGLTTFLNKTIYGVTVGIRTQPTFHDLPIKGLDRIPILGQALFNHNILVYFAFLLIPALWWFLYRTAPGLEMRAVGQVPVAADTVGIDVIKKRYLYVILSGALAGLGGAYLSLAHANTFIENMSAGKGWIAFAIVVFGRYSPLGVLGGSLLFGLADAFQLRLQAVGFRIPYQFLLMLPYVLTIAAISGIMGKANPPAALGKPYEK
jgi:ABC-type uncharacterized transport system permease subunit